ncbi:terpene synthase family protein [Streptomyces flavofungini]|uniref:terpene synthase family protein n=1 Tax=Streptomyces flavofungini TaxID=68200 RepID=UPI0025AF0FAE|nr:terpene synthase family protein [Streptomyces flavofungini]WJV44652.1 terpene synthase family protein [Streptomyces flavofungini]
MAQRPLVFPDLKVTDDIAGSYHSLKPWLLTHLVKGRETYPAHPRTRQLESSVLAWARDLGMSEDHMKITVEATPGHLVGLFAPQAPWGVLLPLAKLQMILFWLNTVDLGSDRPVGRLVEPVRETLERGHSPADGPLILRPIASLRDDVVAAGGTELIPGFTELLLGFLREYTARQAWENGEPLPSLDRYLKHRTRTAGIVLGMWLQRLQPGLVGPGEELPEPLLQLMKQGSLLVGLDNDLHSCHVAAESGEKLSLIGVICQEYGIPVDMAFSCALTLNAALRYENANTAASICADTSLPDAVRRHARAIFHWVDSVYTWSLQTPRYGLRGGDARAVAPCSALNGKEQT